MLEFLMYKKWPIGHRGPRVTTRKDIQATCYAKYMNQSWAIDHYHNAPFH